MEFTKEELIEIEKVFDFWAGQNLAQYAKIIKDLSSNKKCDKIVDKTIKEGTEALDVWRTISAKAHEKAKGL